MTPHDLTAGRELDALIAEKVMGLRKTVRVHGTTNQAVVYTDNPYFNAVVKEADLHHVQPLPYSTSIADAWLVVEKMEHDGFEVELIYAPSNGWSVTFEKGGQFGGSYRNDHQPVTVPLAICIAALAACKEG